MNDPNLAQMVFLATFFVVIGVTAAALIFFDKDQ